MHRWQASPSRVPHGGGERTSPCVPPWRWRVDLSCTCPLSGAASVMAMRRSRKLETGNRLQNEAWSASGMQIDPRGLGITLQATRSICTGHYCARQKGIYPRIWGTEFSSPVLDYYFFFIRHFFPHKSGVTL